VLPAPARLRRREDFTLAVRRGARAGRGTLVVHYLPAEPGAATAPVARVGFVVGRAVGGSVVRHRTVRRLRHLVRDRLRELPAASVFVVRALPAAAGATYGELQADLARCLSRVVLVTGGDPVEPARQP
jgi:ribonuclease P protein component